MTIEGSKVSKGSKEANYMAPDQGPFYCGGCEYYLDKGAESSPFIKVKGMVERLGCCNLFSKDDDNGEE